MLTPHEIEIPFQIDRENINAFRRLSRKVFPITRNEVLIIVEFCPPPNSTLSAPLGGNFALFLEALNPSARRDLEIKRYSASTKNKVMLHAEKGSMLKAF
jgi:hypothetical protein